MKLAILLFLFSSLVKAACPLKDGDVVFIKSQTSQAQLLKIVTDSEWSHVGMTFKHKGKWQIIEAVQPVKWTGLASFVGRSKNNEFEVKRAAFDFDAEKVKSYSESFLNRNYDLIFGWSDERWYCSELVWKAYKDATGEELGELERVGDLQVNHPAVMKEVKERFSGYGMQFDEEVWKSEEVITPVQMYHSEKLQKVFDQTQIKELGGCL